MKFATNFPLLIIYALLSALPAQANAPILISHQGKMEKVQMLKNILTKKLAVPDRLIRILWNQKPCGHSESESLLHLCVAESGEIKFLHAEVAELSQTFKVFRSTNARGPETND